MKTKIKKESSKKTIQSLLTIIILIVASSILFVMLYSCYIDGILYKERLSQMREVTIQLFSGLEDVVKNQWRETDNQCRFVEERSPETVDELIKFMKAQSEITDLNGIKSEIIGVDREGGYYTQKGKIGLLEERKYLLSEPEKVSFVSNSMITNNTQMFFLEKLQHPIHVKDGKKEIIIDYLGLAQEMTELNQYFNCAAYNGKNSVYVMNRDGIKLFNSGDTELLSGYNIYKVLSEMDYLHGSSFDNTKRDLEKKKIAYSNAVLDGKEIYYSLFHMENAEWTLLFMIPSKYVASNTVKIIDMTIRIILVFALLMLIICAVLIFVMVRMQQRKELEAEKQNREQLEKLNKELEETARIAQTAFESAEAANHSKSDFLANMSHDIRTPMNAIMGMTTLIEHDKYSPEKVQEYTDKIKLSSQTLLGIINEVLDMSKIESGKMSLSLTEFTIDEIMEKIRFTFVPQANAKNQEFQVLTENIRHKYLIGDSVRLLQVLNNLLSNALKYTPAGGSIFIRVRELTQSTQRYAKYCFEVQDNGIGMSPEYLARIYDSFSREESSITNRIQGTGLGMAIVKTIVDLMGGSINIQSVKGQGSCFKVILSFEIAADMPESLEQEAAEENISDNGIRGLHFLCAEDNELNAEILMELLHIEGAECEVCVNGEEVVKRFEESKLDEFDAILMDIQMPIMNGYEAAKAIRKSQHPLAKTIPIIAMTANAFSEDVQKALNAGMNAHIAKPVDMKILIKTIYSQF